jgi:hypothetical protein
MQEEQKTLEEDDEFIMHKHYLVCYLIQSFIIQHWQHLSQEILRTDITQGIVLRIFLYYLFKTYINI